MNSGSVDGATARWPRWLPFAQMLVLLPLAWTGDWSVFRRFFSVDDAFFYLTIARNMARGLGATFDGLAATNGYQPLWQWFLAGAIKVTGMTDPDSGVRLFFAVSQLMVVLAQWRLLLLLERLRVPASVQAAVVLSFGVMFSWSYLGLESPLVCVCVVLFVDALCRVWPADRKQQRSADWVWLSIAAAVLSLARLDMIVWTESALLVLAWAHWCASPRLVPTRPMATMVAAAVPIGLFGLWNLATFGHPLTIAASLKARMSWHPLWNIVSDSPLDLVIFACGALPLLIGWRRGWTRALAVGGAAHAIVLCVAVQSTPSRYAAGPAAAGLICLAVMATRLWQLPLMRYITRGVVATAVIVTVTMGVRRTYFSTPLEGMEAFRRNALPHLTRDSVLLAVDPSGELAWFCDCHVINGDGLVNDWAYQRALRAGTLSDELDHRGVQYVMAVEEDNETGPDVILRMHDWYSQQWFPLRTFKKADAIANGGRYHLFRWRGSASRP